MSEEHNSVFVCPNDGEIPNKEVAFLCNTCQVKDAKKIDGIYVCPECESVTHPFQCRLCEADVSWLTPIKNFLKSRKS